MEEILSKIGFDYRVALANLVNFLIVFFILYKFAFPKIQSVLTERQTKIRKGLKDAEDAEKAKRKAEEEAEKTRGKAHQQAKEIIAEGQKERAHIIAQADEEGRAQKESQIKDAQKVISAEKHKAESEVREYGQALMQKTLKNLFQEDVSDEVHDQYAQKVLTYLNE